jgi:FkbM family methyltransferase
MWLRTTARKMLSRFVGYYGYELKVATDPLRGPVEFFKFLSRRGFCCGTLIDVGVGSGTPWLYDAFPSAYLVLVEPNRDFESALGRICAARRGVYYMFAAGSENTKRTIYINRAFPTNSGLLRASAEHIENLKSRSAHETEERLVDVRRLDTLGNLAAPYVIKIDTEGFILPVIEGATGLLPKTELIIAELSVANRFENESSLWRLFKFLEEHSFRLFDLVDMAQTSCNGQLAYIDAVFIKDTS